MILGLFVDDKVGFCVTRYLNYVNVAACFLV